MNHMMDLGPNGWIYLLLGGLLFLFVVLILLYFLSRNHSEENIDKNSKIADQDYQKNTSVKNDVENSYSTTQFCPNCGEKVDSETSKYCPFCGSTI